MSEMQNIYNKLEQLFIQGDLAGAIELMKNIPEMEEIAQRYIDLYENEHYIQYDIPDNLNRILLCYQQYFREVFYLHRNIEEAETDLLKKLRNELDLSDENDSSLEDEMKHQFNQAGYQLLCGKTNGFYGPYVWKETESVIYDVELPETTSTYRINMLRGFVFRSWMDYLTFGERGTGGWTSPDGTINCVEKAYDVNSEKFRVSLLKHEAQHSEDMKRWKDIEPCDLEYRAKLVELIYTQETNLLEVFCSEANEEKTNDSHAIAAVRIKREMGELVKSDSKEIQTRARVLLEASSKELDGSNNCLGQI